MLVRKTSNPMNVNRLSLFTGNNGLESQLEKRCSRLYGDWLKVVAMSLMLLPLSAQAIDELGIYEVDEDVYDDQPGSDEQAWNGTYAVIEGLLDLDNDGVAGETNGDDDADPLLGYEIIDGQVDINDSRAIDKDDDGRFDGLYVVYGKIDTNNDGVSPSFDGGVDAISQPLLPLQVV